MRQVFASSDSAQVGLAWSILDAAGIACEVRNDAVSQAMWAIPFIPELWVVRDEDYEEARRLVSTVGSADSPKLE
jgi:Putative prokaryotic signal transducing protein